MARNLESGCATSSRRALRSRRAAVSLRVGGVGSSVWVWRGVGGGGVLAMSWGGRSVSVKGWREGGEVGAYLRLDGWG